MTTVTETVETIAPKRVERNMDICILLDVSGSMAGAPALEMETQTIEFLCGEQSVVKDDDYVEVNVFSNTHRQLFAPKKRKEISVAEIRSYGIARMPSGGTALWDAMKACIDSRLAYVQSRRAVKADYSPKPYILMVLTDGDSGSDHITTLAALASGSSGSA